MPSDPIGKTEQLPDPALRRRVAEARGWTRVEQRHDMICDYLSGFRPGSAIGRREHVPAYELDIAAADELIITMLADPRVANIEITRHKDRAEVWVMYKHVGGPCRPDHAERPGLAEAVCEVFLAYKKGGAR